MKTDSFQANRGFTLLELLVVLGIISLLAVLLLPVLSKAKGKGHGVRCMSNMRQLNQSWALYAEDHDGNLLPNADTGDLFGVKAGWVSGNMASSLESTNIQLLVDPNASLIVRYSPNIQLFRCPADRSVHMRSYSINCRLNPWRDPMLGQPRWIGGLGSYYPVYRKLNDIGVPSNIFVFVDEREDTINDGSFATDLSNTGRTDGLGTPNPYYMIDFPTDRHNKAGNLSFADGHVESHTWVENSTHPWTATPRTRTAATDRDARWLQEHATELK
ncbi:MAG: prepilin-type N-terminal cleavage/methylation domain-containing protein [Verrucomicrobia bacterium]|nr:prepilin-type N-terminal cleavage/methylation domain-containing protein [Verrucomicrobiota bacterium]